MKDPKHESNPALARFGRDRRPRTVTASTERIERREHVRQDADSEHNSSRDEAPERKSYNPNFTRENRPAFRKDSDRSRDRKPYGERRDDDRRPYGDRERKPYGEHKSFGEHREGDRKPYGERKSYADGEHKPYGERRFGDKKSYGERKPYGDRERKPYGERSEGDRKPYAERKSYGEGEHKSFGNRSFGEKKYGERKFGDKPYGERKFGDKPYGEHKFGDKPRGSRPFGDKKFGDKKFGDRKPGDRAGKPAFRKPRDPEDYPRFAAPAPTGAIRLNRFIAQSGICSRREADEFITAGVVTVNGQIVTQLGTKVMPTDEVKFHDERLSGEKKVYLVLNKPKGYVTTLEDPHAGKIVTDLIAGACTERIYPVGRLDKNSLGLLLFTNDGDLTRQLTHPAYGKKKIYQVSLDKPLEEADMERIAQGVTLEDGDVFADEIAYVKENRQEIGLEIHSGRNRIVRRIFEYLGYTVTKLDRVYYAGLTKKNLKRGAWRFLTREEVERLKSGQYE